MEHVFSKEQLNELLEDTIPNEIKDELFLVLCNTWIDEKYQRKIIDLINKSYLRNPSEDLFPIDPIIK